MVEAMQQAEELRLDMDQLEEEKIFVADFERQWEFENNTKDNLIWQLLRPRFDLAEDMKNSAEQKLQEVS